MSADHEFIAKKYERALHLALTDNAVEILTDEYIEQTQDLYFQMMDHPGEAWIAEQYNDGLDLWLETHAREALHQQRGSHGTEVSESFRVSGHRPGRVIVWENNEKRTEWSIA